MSESNVEIVRRIFEYWQRGDFSYSDYWDEDIDFDMVDWPASARSRGVPAMADTWRTSLGAWENFPSFPTEFVDCGDKVLVLNHIEARGRESGVDVSAETASVFTFRDGKVVRLALLWDVDAARREAEG
ncbi:MAG TPA: nuclear transport factor 2 family protein [Thermoleophilaceae bacterium]|nr:nuclear transport factor 2 family protein [Thermoleophilaceae bacterium]